MRIGYIIAMTVIMGVIGMQANAADIGLVKNGKSDYTIILSSQASPSEKHAADELQSFLFEISGARLPVATEGKALPKHMIVLGDGTALKSLNVPVDFKDLGDEGFAIKTAGSNLVIAGGRLRGTMYGVYTFLEDVLGCRWYSSKVSRIPKKASITLTALDIVEKPDFEYREPFYTDAFDADWAARNKCNSNHANLDEARGGKVIYGRFVHTFSELVSPAKYFKDHPEYFSLVDGKRHDGYAQLCLTNPDVLRIATDGVMRWIQENPNAKIFSVSQNDAYLNCQCDNCKKVKEEEGAPSGVMLRFVNAIAAEVGKKYPNVLIDTLAYQWTEKAPKITKPNANVRVRLCPISQCDSHPYEDCPNNAGFMETLKAWSKITDCLYIWHYNTDFPNYMIPMPDLTELSVDTPMYKRNGVKGIFFEGNYSKGGGGSMDELKAYLQAKLLWNTKADPKQIQADFIKGYFGKAAWPIGEWLNGMEQRVAREKIHFNIWTGVDSPLFSPEYLAESNKLFDQAEKAAESPEILQRVKHARLAIRYVETIKDVNHAAANGTPEQKQAALAKLDQYVKDCEADGITELNEGGPIRARFDQLAAPLKK